MRRILFLSDGSKAAENAARVALHIAQKMHADLLVASLLISTECVITTKPEKQERRVINLAEEMA